MRPFFNGGQYLDEEDGETGEEEYDRDQFEAIKYSARVMLQALRHRQTFL